MMSATAPGTAGHAGYTERASVMYTITDQLPVCMMDVGCNYASLGACLPFVTLGGPNDRGGVPRYYHWGS